MTAVQISIHSTEFKRDNFLWYEFFGSKTNLALVDVADDAEYNDIAFSTHFLRAGLTPGDIWYHWVRARYQDGAGGLAALGPKTITAIGTDQITDGAVTYAKIQQETSQTVLGRRTAGPGTVEEIPVTGYGSAANVVMSRQPVITTRVTVNASADTSPASVLLSGQTGRRNWLIGNQLTANDTFEITPSTADGGSTFSTPVIKAVGATGVVTIPLLTCGTINGNTFTTGTGTLTLGAGKTLTASNTMTFSSTDGANVNFGGGGTVLYSGGSYVSSITGTANEITASASTGAVTLSLPTALTFTGKTITGGTYASPTVSGTMTAATINASGIFTSTKSGAASGAGLSSVAALPFWFLNATGQATDEKKWDVGLNGTVFQIRLLNDAEAVATTVFRIVRSTTTATSANLAATAVGIDVVSPAIKLDVNGPIAPKSYTLATLPSVSAKAGQGVHCTDTGGGASALRSDGTNWYRLAPGYEVQTTSTGAKTLTILTNAETQLFNTVLTGNVTVTLATTDSTGATVKTGTRQRTIRGAAATGAFTFTVNGKSLGVSTFNDAVFDGVAWQNVGTGSL